jgi:non-ribosomal peptide synthetase component F
VTAHLTLTEFPIGHTVVERFAAQAVQTPESVAVIAHDATLTYAALDEASNRLAREFIDRECAPRERVGIVLERSSELVVAILAVLKAGSAYVPLDPTYPRDRLSFASPMRN